MHSRPFWQSAIFTLLLFAIGSAYAQMLPGKHDSIHSNVLKENRDFHVFLPDEVVDPKQHFDTIYVLDGDTDYFLSVVRFLRGEGFMPPVIIVGVPGSDADGVSRRDHDLTPTSVAGFPNSGGAKDYLAFLKTELIPYVDQHYPTNGITLIHGHSLGGLFLMYVLTEDPAVFSGYLIGDPSMWWSNYALEKTLESSLGSVPPQGRTVSVYGRTGRGYEQMGLQTVDSTFRHKAPANLHWTVTAYPDETHGSVKLKGTYDALKFAYQGYTTEPLELAPSAGILIKGKPFPLEVSGDDDNGRFDLHYTTDGTVPNSSSQRVDNFMSISDPATTTVKLLSSSGRYNRVIPHHFALGAALAPTAQASADGAWHAAFYLPQEWLDLDHAKAFKTVDTNDKLESSLIGRDSFTGTFKRNVYVPADGYYVLYVNSPDRARVSIGGRLLIDHDGDRGSKKQGFVLPLRPGVYALKIDFERTPGASFQAAVYQSKVGDPEWWKNPLVTLDFDR